MYDVEWLGGVLCGVGEGGSSGGDVETNGGGREQVVVDLHVK